MSIRVISTGLILFGGICFIGGVGLLLLQFVQPMSIKISQPPSLPPTAVLAGVTVEPPPMAATLPLMPIMPIGTRVYQPISTSTRQVFVVPTPTARPHPPTATSPAPAALPTIPIPQPPERIVIPSIEVDAPLVAVGWQDMVIDGRIYSQWAVPDGYVGGWHQTSARAGELGNMVINGHHNRDGGVFKDLVKLIPSDVILIYVGGKAFRYQVVQTMILPERDQPLAMRQANARWLLPTLDERVTLITCWPSDDNSHRLVVIELPLE